MIPQNRIKERLASFLSEDGAKYVMDNCLLSDRSTWLNNQVNLKITQSDADKIVIEIKNNSNQGYTEYKQTYKL